MACWKSGAVPTDGDSSSAAPGLSSIDLDHLLATNDAPTDFETAIIQDYITNGRRRNEIPWRSVARLYPKVLSPVRRIPPELICEIFSCTLPFTTKIGDQAVDLPPWYLGHISRAWRATALAYPSLWTSITILNCRDHPSNNPPSLAMFKTQLLRSENAPLTIHFRCNNKSPCRILAALLPHSSRWKSLYFQFTRDSYPFLLRLLRLARGQFTLLTRVEFCHTKNFLEDISAPSNIFSVAPVLREVLLTHPDFDCNSPNPLIPWGQITRYRGVFSFRQQLHILRAASNLIECGLGIRRGGRAVSSDRRITLPHLRRLFIEQGEILPHLTAPTLEYFSCKTLDSVTPFIHRSFCQLTTLALIAGHFGQITLLLDDFITLLQSTPFLQNLVFQDYSVAKEDNARILRAMTVSGSPDDLCPALSYLGYGHPGYVFSQEVFLIIP
ncbi:hypothetical protein B0H13DRAFT_2658224 [Mycena leptocephala]|nr:hypothetical protein B0H13DRAFT_2658224 [Mycena leptocephala]